MPINTVKKDEELKASLKMDIVKRLLGYMKPYKRKIIGAIILMIFAAGINLLNPMFLKIGIDKYIANKDIKGIITIGIVMILINVTGILFSKKRILIMSRLTNKILLNIRQELYKHIQKLSFGFFDSRPTGKILARVIGDINGMNELFSSSITNLIPDMITIIAVAGIMLIMNWKLALLALALVPVMIIVITYIQIKGRERWQAFRKKASNLNAFTHESLSGIRVIKSCTAEKHMEKTFDKLIDGMEKAFIKVIRLVDLFWPFIQINWGIGVVVIFYFGSNLVRSGDITVGLLVAFIGYLSMFWMPIENLSNFYNVLIMNITAAERVFEILDIEAEIKNIEEAAIMPPVKGQVEFVNVDFEYDVYKGAVRIDGIDVRDVTIESLRNQIGVMTQDNFLFSGSIRDNIAYGKLDATDEEIIKCAKIVCAHDFIMKLESGYDTLLNERGLRLSTGQRQLIALARTLLAGPKILILDEATASIDTYTERQIQEGIEELLKGRTSFVIAHRLSTIKNADRVFVVNQGEIVEEGTHDELLKNVDSIYTKMLSVQYSLK